MRNTQARDSAYVRFGLVTIFLIGLYVTACAQYGILTSFGGHTSGFSTAIVASPYCGVATDTAGNMYGTSTTGGSYAGKTGFGGTIWKRTADGRVTILHSFGGPLTLSNGSQFQDGWDCYAELTRDNQGNLYGTTHLGGLYGGGLVWELTKTGQYLDLHDFEGTVTHRGGVSGPDGYGCAARVTLDALGNIYGTTTFGGLQEGGTVWNLTKAGTYSVIYDFGGYSYNNLGQAYQNPILPEGAVTFDPEGNMYGTASAGGIFADSEGAPGGAVWKISVDGTYQILHSFGARLPLPNGATFADGDEPQGNVTFDAAGNLYGSTPFGGANATGSYYYGGILWEITKTGQYLVLHSYGSVYTQPNGLSAVDGKGPGNVAVDSTGNLYGSTGSGGKYGQGMIWKLAAGGSYSNLHDFGSVVPYPGGTSGPDGSVPCQTLALDPAGDILGVALAGGLDSDGAVFELFNQELLVKSVTLAGHSVIGGNRIAGTLTLSHKADFGGMVTLSSNSSDATVPSNFLVNPGAETVPFTVETTPVTTPTTVLISVGSGVGHRTVKLTINPG